MSSCGCRCYCGITKAIDELMDSGALEWYVVHWSSIGHGVEVLFKTFKSKEDAIAFIKENVHKDYAERFNIVRMIEFITYYKENRLAWPDGGFQIITGTFYLVSNPPPRTEKPDEHVLGLFKCLDAMYKFNK